MSTAFEAIILGVVAAKIAPLEEFGDTRAPSRGALQQTWQISGVNGSAELILRRAQNGMLDTVSDELEIDQRGYPILNFGDPSEARYD